MAASADDVPRGAFGAREEPETPPLRISLCGELRVECGGERLDQRLPGRRGRLLVAYLALHRERPVSRDEIIEALWDDKRTTAPRAALSVLLSRTRQALAPAGLEDLADRAVALPAHTVVDVEEAAAALDRAAAETRRDEPGAALGLVASALAVLERPLLPGAESPWLDDARRRLGERYEDGLESLARAALATGGVELVTAERAARRLVKRDPYRESNHALLMRCHLAEGNKAEAARAYENARLFLRDELGLTPSAELRALAGQAVLDEDSAPAVAAPQRAQPPPLPVVLRRRAQTPFCGRDHDLAELAAWWSDDAAGVRLCALCGEAGIGKTRLAAELARIAQAAGALVLYGRSDDAAPVPYQPVIESVRQLVAIRDVPADGARETELAELARLIPQLRTRGYEPIEPPTGDPQLRRYRVFEAATKLLVDAAEETGLLLVLDDLQWADEPTVALLRHLLRADVGGRLAILALYRTTEVDDAHPLLQALSSARRERLLRRIVLTGLDGPAVARLVQASVPGGATAAFLDSVRGRTAGNPLYLEEILHEVRDAAPLRHRAADVEDLARVGVPEGARITAERRLSRLGEETADVLADAAAIGLEFDLSQLEALAAPGRDPLVAIERAVDAGIVLERAPLNRFGFAHALVREAIYNRRTRARRARAHRRIAHALEADPSLGGTPADLARHWQAAGDVPRLVGASLAAGRAAGEIGGFDEAFAHYRRALRAWPRSGRGDAERIDALEAAAEVARWAGHPDAAAACVRKALKLTRDADREPRLRERLGRYLWEAARWEPSARAYEEAAQALRGRPPSVDSARALAGQAGVQTFRERFGAAIALAREAVAIARKAGARREEGHALNTLGSCLTVTGNPEEGLADLHEALAIAREVGSLEDQCRAYVNLSECLTRAGKTGEAAAVALEGYDFTRRHGLERSGTPMVAANAVAALVRLGRWDEAERLADESLSDENSQGMCAYLRTVRAHLSALRGDERAFVEELKRAEPIVRATYEPALVTELQASIAEVALQRGDAIAARNAVEQALEALDDEQENGELTLRLCALGLRVAGLEPSARAWGGELADRAERVRAEMAGRGALLPAAAAFAAAARAEHGLLEGRPASAAFAEARAAFARIGDRHSAARADLGEARALLREGRAPEAAARVSAATATARALQAPPLLAEAEAIVMPAASPGPRAATPTG